MVQDTETSKGAFEVVLFLSRWIFTGIMFAKSKHRGDFRLKATKTRRQDERHTNASLDVEHTTLSFPIHLPQALQDSEASCHHTGSMAPTCNPSKATLPWNSKVHGRLLDQLQKLVSHWTQTPCFHFAKPQSSQSHGYLIIWDSGGFYFFLSKGCWIGFCLCV